MGDTDFNCLLGDDSLVTEETYQEAAKFNHSKQVLKKHDILTAEIKTFLKDQKKNEQAIKVFKDRKTLKLTANTVFKRMEKWYIDHVMKTQYRDSAAKKNHMEKLLMEDPVGTNTPGKDDTYCWKSNVVVTQTPPISGGGGSTITGTQTRSASARLSSALTPPTTVTTQSIGTTTDYKRTEFLINLEHVQNSMYLYLRASLVGRFTDKDAKTRLESFIDDKETALVDNGTMNDMNRFNKDIRVKWSDIKEFVTDEICIQRMGSHQFLGLFTTMRKDQQSVIQWVKTYENMHSAIAKQSQEWKKIADEEIVPAIAIWLTNTERGVIMDKIHKENLHTKYKTFDDLSRTMELVPFRRLIHSIAVSEWPKAFLQRKHKSAVAKTLVPYKQITEAVQAAVNALREENNDLRAKLKKANDKIKMQQRQIDTLTGRLKKLNGNTKLNTITITQNKAPKGCCQKCWDSDLGARKHRTEDCDDKRRKAAIAKKERMDKQKAQAQANNNNKQQQQQQQT